MQLFNENGVVKKFCLLKDEFNLESNMHFLYIQLLHAIPNSWKSNIQQKNSDTDKLIAKDQHIIQKSRIITVNKLHYRKLNLSFTTNVKQTSP